LPWAFVVVALAVGFGLGRNNAGTTKAATPSTPVVTPDQISQALSGNGLGLTTVNDRGYSKLENGFQHTHGFPLPVTPDEQVLLSHQMDVARETAMQYPTLADAEAAGLMRAGPYSPGLGLHMIAPKDYAYSAGASVLTDAQIQHPLAWIYDGTKPTSRVAGLFYMSFVANPGGFAGPNDIWHYHTNICSVRAPDGSTNTPLGADRTVTKAQCDAVHGTLLTRSPYLLHAWVVPGYEDPEGAFAHNNAALTCNDGTYHEINISDLGDHLTTCVDGTE
jgi:hypothetical protein